MRKKQKKRRKSGERLGRKASSLFSAAGERRRIHGGPSKEDANELISSAKL